jgi:hypothetical protein
MSKVSKPKETSDLMTRLQAFLPQMEAANQGTSIENFQ